MAPAAQAEQESTSEGVSRGCTAARFSPWNGATEAFFFRLVVLKNGSDGALLQCRAALCAPAA